MLTISLSVPTLLLVTRHIAIKSCHFSCLTL